MANGRSGIGKAAAVRRRTPRDPTVRREARRLRSCRERKLSSATLELAAEEKAAFSV
jgi:hypothetical protein